jgi:hypothetical protein
MAKCHEWLQKEKRSREKHYSLKTSVKLAPLLSEPESLHGNYNLKKFSYFFPSRDARPHMERELPVFFFLCVS